MNNYSTEEGRKRIVEKWESMDTEKLSKLFSLYLFRIRNWSRGYSARYFSKNDIEIFKGVSPDVDDFYPFADMLRITHFYVEDYNSHFHRNIDRQEKVFPFQIDGTIIDGKRFFEMEEHYQIVIDDIKSEEMREKYSTLALIENYDGCFRTGDKYIRNLFYCALIYYIDRFGDRELLKAIDKIFIWAYSLRLRLKTVGLDSVDNFALNRGNSEIQLFKVIKEALRPNDILNLRFETLKENRSTKTIAIVELLRS